MSDALLQVRHLDSGYGGMPVLQAVSIDIAPSEIVAIVGSNAAGKTTLLRALSRIIGCTGEIRFAGRDILPLSSEQVFALGLVQVPEGRQLFDRMTVNDNLLMGAFRRGDRRAVEQTIERSYALFPEIADRRGQLAGSLSGGEQQMCAMARALMAAPKLLMVDEMSLGLAPTIVDRLLEILLEIRKGGVTVLLVEQDVRAALDIADRAYVLASGRVVKSGAAKDLAGDPQVRGAYLGLD